MKKIGTTILVIAILIIAIVSIYFVVTDSGLYESDTEFGFWGQLITVNYEDGSSESLSLLFGGKEVESLTYELRAKNTLEEPIIVDLSDYKIDFSIGDDTYTYFFTGTSYSVPADGDYHSVETISVSASLFETPEEDCNLVIEPGGIITYSDEQFNPETCIIPSSITETIPFKVTTDVFDLTVNINGDGKVYLDPEGGIYPAGTEVILTAVPDSGWAFESWGTWTQNPLNLTINGDMVITATFVIPTEENFLTYQELDPAEYITVSSSSYAIVNNMPADAVASLKKEKPLGNGDFTMEFDWTINYMESGGRLVFAFVEDGSINTLNDMSNKADGLFLEIRAYIDSQTGLLTNTLALRSLSGQGVDTYMGLNIGTIYHLTMTRSSGNILVELRDTGLITTLEVLDGTNIQYFLPIASQGLPFTGRTASGSISNVIFG